MEGSRSLDSRFERDVGIHPDETRDRGQVPVVPKPRRMAGRGQTRTTRWRVLRADHGWDLTRTFATTSPTRPHVAASSYGWTVLPTRDLREHGRHPRYSLDVHGPSRY